MRPLVLLAGALAVPVLAVPVLTASPASAANNVICVLPAATGCNQTVATIPLAIALAGSNGVANTIQLGATTYSNAATLSLDGFTHALTLRGASQGTTFLTSPSSGTTLTYVSASTATVADLTITMTGGANSNGDVGLYLSNTSVADHVTVDAATTQSATGIGAGLSTISHSTISAPPDDVAAVRGIFSSGGNTVSDTSLAGAPAFDLSDPGTIDHLSRVSIRSDNYAVTTDGGSISIDDAVIDLGVADNAIGLAAVNQNNSANPKTITADQVTIVGGGAGSRGVWAFAAAAGAAQTTTVSLTNSIVRGPATSLVADAGNDGSPGAPSNATLNVSYTDYQTKGGTIGAHGTGGVVEGAGNLVAVDPGFVSASDRHLTAGSNVVDKGDPAAGGPAIDLDGNPRVQDGDLDGTAVRDMGAYELSDTTPPDTTIDTGPTGPTGNSTPTFTFSSTEPGSSFVCQLDAGAESACTSPLTTSALLDGTHTLSVTATDAFGNSDATPATRQWVVDTVAPDTTISSGPTDQTNDPTPTFTFTSEVGASFECAVDAASYAACATPFTTSALADGAHTFSVRAADSAANRDATPAARTFTVDTAAPEVTITKKPAKRTTKAKVKIGFTAEAGATFECQVDGKAWKACASPDKVKVKVGKHIVLVRAIDAAGNVGTPAKVKFKRVAAH